MDKIVLEGLDFHGHHGVFEEEARLGARFTIDVELYLDLPEEDLLACTVDYSRVYRLVRHEVTEQRYRLIETLATRIAQRLLETEPAVGQVVVRVHKPHAPLPGVLRNVYVEVRRDRAAD